MAKMFSRGRQSYHLIDAGAGVGSLTAAWIEELCKHRPASLHVTVFETDPLMLDYLRSTIDLCAAYCHSQDVSFFGEIRGGDFIETTGRLLAGNLFSNPARYDCAIMNPPYRKINSDSETRLMLREVGIESTNLYTAFLALVSRLLIDGGELVAITPRSFCNGPYFRPFREEFLREMALSHITVFESRKQAFRDDEVLQENLIFRAVKGGVRTNVVITSLEGPEDNAPSMREIPFQQVVQPGDPNSFIHITTDNLSHQLGQQMAQFTKTLEDLGIAVSTGRVVDFRVSEFLRGQPGNNTAPLIYPTHLSGGRVEWPKQGIRKPNALEIADETLDWLVPDGNYVLVKRFSSKEERRRVVATLYQKAELASSRLGFENHLNYYHCNGGGMPLSLAKGLAVFLNSTLVDTHFRNFNGHTQVNATDLRSFKYPSREALETLGSRIKDTVLDQAGFDRLVEEVLMAKSPNAKIPIQAKNKIAESLLVLKALDLPKSAAERAFCSNPTVFTQS